MDGLAKMTEKIYPLKELILKIHVSDFFYKKNSV